MAMPLSWFSFVLLGASVPAATTPKPWTPPKTYVSFRAATPPTIDGRIDDKEWAKAPWTDDFVDIEGTGAPSPRFRTRARMLWDDRYFYIAAALEEPHVWGTLAEHDAVIHRDNNNFEVFIDPNGDNHEYYELEINALGTTWDLFLARPYRDGGQPLHSWEIAGAKTAVHVDGTLNDPSDADRGWSVEIAFPWAVLKHAARRPSPPEDGDLWRVNFSRVEWRHEVTGGRYVKLPRTPERREDNWVWSPQGLVNMHWPERWGYVQFAAKDGGDVPVRPDPLAAGRDLLHRLYYAQRAYKKAHGSWARRLEDLDVPLPKDGSFVGAPVLESTTHLFQISVTVKTAAGPQRVHIRQDSLFWSD
jgi:hypothetical protein